MKGGKKKPANSRAAADHYSLKARQEGYPARSVYKLQEIQERFAIFPRNGNILDVGAAPGSWSLFVLRHLSGSGRLLAVDLKTLNLENLPPNYTFLQGDVFSGPILETLRENGPYDAVLSDAAPDTSGNRGLDTSRSAALAEGILSLCPGILKPGGNLLVKIFQGGEEQRLLAEFRRQFSAARTFKPKACRKDSFETYLIGTGFLIPESSS